MTLTEKPEAGSKTGPSVVHPTPALADLAALTSARKQAALMEGNGDKVGYWLTPAHFFDPLNAKWNFTFDACPYPRPAGFDGLKEEWGPAGGTVWVNPPFQGRGVSHTAWARRAIDQATERNVVLILPVHRWINRLVGAGFSVEAPAPFDWLNPAGRIRKKQTGPACLLFSKTLDSKCPACGGPAP